MNERTCLDIFTGLGCFSIAARACGVRTVGMCEIKSDCRHFLAANWPGVAIHDNAKTLDAAQYRGVWLVCGGPPCQPASVAGEQRGAEDHRWLWPEAVRIVGQAQPTWFLFENPPGIRTVGLDGVLSDLEAQGYEVGEPLNIPACAIDAPHRRERLWIVGHRQSRGLAANGSASRQGGHADQSGATGHVAHAKGEQLRPGLCDSKSSRLRRGKSANEIGGGNVANSESIVGRRDEPGRGSERRDADGGTVENGTLANGVCGELAQRECHKGDAIGNQQPPIAGSLGWGLWGESAWIECGDGKRRRAKPGVCGVVNGPSVGLLEALGNAILWPIAARIIAAMIQAEEQ